MNFVLPALLVIIFYKYMGFPYLIPALKGLNLDLFMSVGVLIWLTIHGEIKGLLRHKQTKIFICFLLIGCVSILYAIIRVKVLASIKLQIENLILLCICYYVFKNTRKINIFVVFFVAINTLLVILNVDQLLTSSRGGQLKAGYFLSDENDFSWSLVVTLPFAIYLFSTGCNKLLKLASLGSVLTIIMGIILAESRGAAIAAVASVIWFVFSGRRRAFGLAVLVCSIVAVVVFAPSSYFQRLDTIRTYNEDSSARGRLMAWRAAVAMAVDYPYGVGPGNFPNVYGRFYRDKYADPSVWSSNRWIAIHSIYFQALAEYGFLGLTLLLLLIYWSFVSNLQMGHNMKIIGNVQSISQAQLPSAINASLIAFAIGGIFLGNINYPHIIILSSMTMGLNAFASQTISVKKTEQR